MKRSIVCLILLLILTACGGKPTAETPLETASETYTLEQAKAEGCVVFENSVVTAGQEVWDGFLAKTESGKPASVRLFSYHTLDKDRCSPEYYEAHKDDDPWTFTQDLSFHGDGYTIRYFSEGEEFVETYRCLKRFDEYPYADTPEYRMVIYMLLNDENATYSDYMASMLSSDSRTERVEGTTAYYALAYDKVLRGGEYSVDAGGASDNIWFDMKRSIFNLNHDLMSSLGTFGFFTIEDVDTIRCVSNDLERTYLFRILDNDTIAYVKEGSDEIGFVEPIEDGTEFKRVE